MQRGRSDATEKTTNREGEARMARGEKKKGRGEGGPQEKITTPKVKDEVNVEGVGSQHQWTAPKKVSITGETDKANEYSLYLRYLNLNKNILNTSIYQMFHHQLSNDNLYLP